MLIVWNKQDKPRLMFVFFIKKWFECSDAVNDKNASGSELEAVITNYDCDF